MLLIIPKIIENGGAWQKKKTTSFDELLATAKWVDSLTEFKHSLMKLKDSLMEFKDSLMEFRDSLKEFQYSPTSIK
jgi:hypothetical protein